MAVSNVIPVTSYVALSGTSIYEYPFRILAEGDLQVFVDGEPQIGGYTITGVGNDAGGNVQFSVPPSPGSIILLQRSVSVDRSIDYTNGGRMNADTFDYDMDRTVMMIQDSKIDGIKRAIGSTAWDAQGSRIINLGEPIDETDAVTKGYIDGLISGAGIALEQVREVYTATEGQTIFVLTRQYVVGANNLTVYINGVRQPQTEYTETNAVTVTMTDTLEEGDIVEFVWNEFAGNTVLNIEFDLVTDLSPQLGANLDLNGHNIGLAGSPVLSVDSARRVFLTNASIQPAAGGLSVSTGGSAVTTINAAADEVVVESNGNAGITIATPNSSIGSIRFADPQQDSAGMIRYLHSTNEMVFSANNSAALTVRSNGVMRVAASDYETLVTDDDDVPNKKYVDDAVDAVQQASLPVEQYAVSTTFQGINTTWVNYLTLVVNKTGRKARIDFKATLQNGNYDVGSSWSLRITKNGSVIYTVSDNVGPLATEETRHWYIDEVANSGSTTYVLQVASSAFLGGGQTIQGATLHVREMNSV